MYESFYGLTAKPFQLKPDPSFYFGSKGHKRAMAYLEYGLSQGEGFIVITGEVGAGKTTLVRNLFRELDSHKILAAQIVNTHLNSDDTLRMVAGAFGLQFEGATKATLLTRIEQFLRQCDQNGQRALLVVDEAQNLSPQTVEELRMLSNFQTDDKSLLQTFLLGQPEFRKTLLSPEMLQLRQRVIATYHLGPMDAAETRTYIEHRLHTVGWTGDPSIEDAAFSEIHAFTGGIPRKINTLCDRLFLMGYLEELHAFSSAEIQEVIGDMQQEFDLPIDAVELEHAHMGDLRELTSHVLLDQPRIDLDIMDERLSRIERSVVSVLDALRKILSSPRLKSNPQEPHQ